ncbi:MAG: hypothetical protein H6Q55_2961 [Deltaproteobacteria bacterium]|jgi:hypothetical protein|nr:hypothetical protein [Deltaproteobacteria bacterium]
MEERRIKTFIELTRQTLDEESIGEKDFRQRSRRLTGDRRTDEKRRRDHLTRKQ